MRGLIADAMTAIIENIGTLPPEQAPALLIEKRDAIMDYVEELLSKSERGKSRRVL